MQTLNKITTFLMNFFTNLLQSKNMLIMIAVIIALSKVFSLKVRK